MNRHDWIRMGLAAMAMAAAPAIAQEPEGSGLKAADATTSQVVTGEAQLVLERMTGYLNGLDRFEVTMQGARDEVLPYGYKLQNNESVRMVVHRPDRLRVDVDGDIKHRSYYFDGSTLTIVAPDEGVYARMKAPGTIADLVDELLDAGVELPLIDVLGAGFHGTLLDGVQYGMKVGNTRLGGTLTDHLAFRQATIDWQMWIARDGQPRKLLITTRYEVGNPQYQSMMRWNLRPGIDATTFVFKPSRDMREIQFENVAAVIDAAGDAP